MMVCVCTNASSTYDKTKLALQNLLYFDSHFSYQHCPWTYSILETAVASNSPTQTLICFKKCSIKYYIFELTFGVVCGCCKC